MERMGLQVVLCAWLGLIFGCSDPALTEFPPGAEGEAEETVDAAGPEAAPASEANTQDAAIDLGIPTDPWPDVDAGQEAQDAQDAAEEVEEPEPAGPEGKVVFLQPADGATVCNPVLFQVASRNVDLVQIFADAYPLSDPWDPNVTTQLEYTFLGVGYPRLIRVVGLDHKYRERASQEIVITVTE
ncbi:MAG: hypothetical protein CVU63_08385 [Deltaproteobacteria bacterium HGW-Deltaproteobacteria-20]|nr:MAG: hypothetical protein CVU63_08385 [Deltaproteobacteria bacterium HGW-Deltaproteobacteria-20]